MHYAIGQTILQEGKYKGTIEQKCTTENAIITVASYLRDPNPIWHYHENMHIALLFENAKSETKKGEVNFDKEGRIAFYHSEEMHRFATNRPISKGQNVEIPISFLRKYSISECDIKEAIMKKSFAKSLMLNMQSEMSINDENSESSILSLLLDLISKPSKANSEIPMWANLLKDVLYDCWNEPLTLAILSNIVGVHPVTISKRFRSYFACTLGEYRRKVKIERSLALIKGSEMSLSEVAHYCNFADQSHFIRNFRKYTGFLPSEFKHF